MEEDDNWVLLFSLSVLFSLIFSGVAYYIQFEIFNVPGKYNLLDGLIRTIRMIVGYVIPAIVFTYYFGGSIRDLGVYPSKKNPMLSILIGISIYIIATWVFLKYHIFSSTFSYQPIEYALIYLIMVGIMASITDFWTRGFVLFQLEKKYNATIAIIGQNIIWFVIHIYEIDLLSPYIGIFWSIVLTLFLGIAGDLVAIYTKSITGLMLGHIFLNVGIFLSGRGIIHL